MGEVIAILIFWEDNIVNFCNQWSLFNKTKHKDQLISPQILGAKIMAQPIKLVTEVPASYVTTGLRTTVLLIHLSSNASKQATEDVPSARDTAPMWETQM